MAAPQTFRVQGLVLDRTKLGEQDLIITLLDTTGQQVKAIAKGARKSGSKLSSRTDFFIQIDALMRYGKGSLPYIGEAEILKTYTSIRMDLDKLEVALAALDIARLVSFEDAQDTRAYPMLVRMLDALELEVRISHYDLYLAAYVFKILAHFGWIPVLDGCVICSEPDIFAFSPVSGGVICESCVSESEQIVSVDTDDIAWIHTLIYSTFDQLTDVDMDTAYARWLTSLAHKWAATHLDARMKAFEYRLGI